MKKPALCRTGYVKQFSLIWWSNQGFGRTLGTFKVFGYIVVFSGFQRNIHGVVVAGEAEHDFQPVVIVDVNAYQEKAEQIGLELLVLDVAFSQRPQSGDQIVTVHFDLISLGGLYLGVQL